MRARRCAALVVTLSLLWGAATARAVSTARVIDEQAVGARGLDLTILSPALGGTAHVLLFLPPDWSSQPERRWPVLWLLHGALDDVTYRSWATKTDAEQLTAQRNVLVVMPEGGAVGWYSDWWNGGHGGPPRWERFHLHELRRILVQRYRAGNARAVAGLSMGGFGAASYAARHPGMFRAVASYSGALHTRPGFFIVQGSLALAGFDPDALWGDPVVQARIWSAHDPFDLARGLVGTPVFIASGDGHPGPLDPPGIGEDPIEPLALIASHDLADRLRQLGGRVTTDFYGAGTHRWPYWQQELHRSFGMLVDAIGAEPPATAR